MTLATSLRRVGLVLGLLMAAGAALPALAVDYYASSTGGSWSANTTWHVGTSTGPNPTPGVYPGSAAGDRAFLQNPGTVTVDLTIPNGIELQQNCSCTLSVPSGGQLRISSASSVSAAATLAVSGGTIVNSSSISFAPGANFDWSGGTLNGGGSVDMTEAFTTGSRFDVLSGTNTISDQTVNVFSTFDFSGGNLSINSGATVNVTSTGEMLLGSGAAIGSDLVGNPGINNDGTVRTYGSGSGNIGPSLNNNGLVDVQVGGIVLGGTHTNGTFNLPSTSNSLELHGTMVGTVDVTGPGTVSIVGTPTVDNGATLNLVNVAMNGGWLQGPASGAGTANISGTVTFNGGVWKTNLTVNLLTGSTVNFVGGSSGFIDDAAAVIASGATLNINPGTGTFGINNGAVLTNNGTINILGDTTITSDLFNNPGIVNNSSINKTAGGGTANINCRVDNAAGGIAVVASAGVLKLNGGGTHSADFNTGTGSGIAFNGGTHQFNAGSTLTGTGTFALNAGTMDVDTFIAVPSAATFQQSGGVLTGNANFRVDGPFLWTGGTMDDSSGTGQTILIGSSSQIASTISAPVLSGRTISNTGTFTYNPTAGFELSINDDGSFLNTGGFNIVGDPAINGSNNTTPTFINGTGGAINKSTGTGTATFNVYFQNNSSLNLSSGSITLKGGGQDFGIVNFGGSGTNAIIIDNCIFAQPTATGFNGTGILTVTGASANLNLLASLSVTKFELLGGAQVSGAGNLTINTSMLWKNGSMTGTGTTIIASSVPVDATAPDGPLSLSRPLTNNGTISWNGNTQNFNILTGGTLTNNLVFDAQGNGTLGTAAGSIVNAGTLKKTGGTSGTRIDSPITNSGSISSEVSGQSLIIAGGGSQTGGGSLNTLAGALIDFFSGTYSVAAGTSPFFGSGIFRVNGGTLAITGSTSVPSPATLVVESGALDVATSVTFQVFYVFQWTGGTLQGNGTTRVFGGYIDNTAPTSLTANHTLTVPASSFNYDADTVNYLTIGGTANLNVESGASFFITGDSIIGGTSTDGVTVSGSLIKTGTGVGRIVTPLTITSGTAPVFGATGGTLEIAGGGSAGVTSTLETALSGIVEFDGGVFTLGTGVTVSGGGTIMISSGTLNVDTPAITFPNFVFNAGTLGGSGALTVANGDWYGGTMTGTGTTTIGGSASFLIATGSAKTLARTLSTTSGAIVTMSDGFTFSGAGSVVNAAGATWADNYTGGMGCSACTGSFDNLGGYFVYDANSYPVAFDNDGTVTNAAGAVSLALAAGGTHTGDFNSGSATLQFGGTHNFSAASDITGSGVVSFLNNATHLGTLVLTGNGNVVIGSTASLTFNGASAATTPSVNISGDLGGTGAFSVIGGTASAWNDGTLSGTGAFTIASGGAMTISSGAGTPTLDGKPFTNSGTLALTGNLAAGLSGGTVNNPGAFRAQPAGPVTFAPAFTNSGAAQFGSGDVAFNGGYTQTAGTTELVGGTLSSPLTINIDGGSVIGTGVIGASVSNDGTLAPGASAGTLTISGNYTQSSTGVINAEIGGNTAGTLYDQLVVTGAATLDGTMNVALINGFVPADGDVFDLVTWGSHTGAFATVNLPAYPIGTLTPTYETSAFRITADTVTDVSISKTGPATAGVGQNVSFTIQVTNGQAPATSVVVSDPTPANMTFVSNSGDCTTAFPCSLGTVAANTTKTITATYAVTGGAGTTITNTATVSTTSTESSSTNNSASAGVFIELADLVVTKTGPATAPIGQNVTFTITVKNLGPSPAAGVVVTDPTPAKLSFVSNSGDCTTSFPCSLGTIGAGVTKTISATYNVTGPGNASTTNTATATTTTSEGNTSNNSGSASLFIEPAGITISKSGPTRALPHEDITFTISVANNGQSAAENVNVTDPTPAGLNFLGNEGDCTTPFPCALGTIPAGGSKTIIAKYSVNAGASGTTITNTATVHTTTADNPVDNSDSATVQVGCLNTKPSDLSPAGEASASGILSWRGTGDSYIVYLGPAGSGCSTKYATTSGRSVSYSNLAPGTYEWRVESVDVCGTIASSCVTFTIANPCVVPGAPLPSVVGQATSAKTYEVTWDPVAGATRYEIDEADNPAFNNASRVSVTGTSQSYKHDVTEATAFYYRVRALADCIATPGAFSPTVRVVIIPLPPPTEPKQTVNIPAGSQEIVFQEVFIPGEAGQNLLFNATTDRPWLSVQPSSGVITPAGITLKVLADPRTLPNGTFTASVIVTIVGTSGNIATQNTTTTVVPISINLVTPVTPVTSKPSSSQYALIIPSAGHLSGIGSKWQSDVRVTNAGFKSTRYQLTFTPAGGTAQGVKQTTITVDAGATTALDDIISNWFGLGTLGDGANGMLEILPLDDPATTSLTTVASSRTYNVTGNGTLGQYIPAIPFPSFIGKALPNALPQILSLQQIAQNAAYRTNVGLAEASGAPVNAVVSIFNAGGTKLADVPVQLAAGEQRQMNQLLASQGIELGDGRIEVKVTGGDGKVTAYASVVDSASQDPLLVSGEPLSGSGATKYVLPGVANLDNSLAHWRTDMRVFNYGSFSQPATLTFFPLNNGPSKSVDVNLSAGQVLTLDNVLSSQFGVENTGGVVHLSTPQPASLVVTGRTYNQTDAGTFGQFVPAVTAQQAAGLNERTLHILQVEDSTRYRTNVGLAEVTGQPVTVEIQIVLPDSKITPTVHVTLAPNEFQQFNPIRALGIGNVYNARITVRVVEGQGRVTAYGSVIDELTQDPTYVPAQ